MLRSIAPVPDDDLDLATIGQAANNFAAKSVFEDYRTRKAANTIRRQDSELSTFREYLESKGVQGGNLAEDAEAWKGITWGLVAGFLAWLLGQGYAVGSVNLHLSTIKKYSKLAFTAGVMSAQEFALIKALEGYAHREAKHLDDKRQEKGIPTRIGYKKPDPVILTDEQAKFLKTQPDTPQGKRDALIMCLMMDHGLRVSEVTILKTEDFNLKIGTLTFYRPRLDMAQVHKLTPDTLKALKAYKSYAKPGLLLRGSTRGGKLNRETMSLRAIKARVKELGEEIGIEKLSPHDLRHYWATKAARFGTSIDSLQKAGGWTSPAMPVRYFKFSNEGVKLYRGENE